MTVGRHSANFPEIWALLTASQMHELDRYTIDQEGVASEVLMERAGQAVFECVMERLAARSGWDRQVWVLCGPGNNGGDGFVVGRLLADRGIDVHVVAFGGSSGWRGAAGFHRDRCLQAGVALKAPDSDDEIRGVVVDALLGIGLKRPVAGVLSSWVHRVETLRARGEVEVVSVDVPSGLDSDTGQVLGHGIRADLTVTISAPKVGLSLEPGRSLAGEIRVARIGIAEAMPGESEKSVRPKATVWTRGRFLSALPVRGSESHKGTFGHVLLVAGSEGKSGAAALAAKAALRAGSGLVTVACPRSLHDLLEVQCLESMTLPVAETPGRSLARGAGPGIVNAATVCDVVALGPGIGRESETVELVHDLLDRLPGRIVLDADGLNALEGDLSPLVRRSGETIITPHPGEAGRLLGVSANEINADRVSAARRLSRASGCFVALKGAATVCAAPSGDVVINPTGGPNLATAGSGDVLTGVVASLVGQGLVPWYAAVAGVWWHGWAGDCLAREKGSRGTLAHEVADALPWAVHGSQREGQREPRKDGVLLFPDP